LKQQPVEAASVMGRMEALLGKALFSFLFKPAVFFSLLFLARAVFFTTLEIIRPARAISYRSVIWSDLVAFGMYVSVVIPAASYLSRFVPGHHPFPAFVSHWPIALRVALYFILADFGHYWIHRLHHTRYFWQMHKWHHSPTYMYWLGGVRATIPQQFMVNVPYVLAYPFLDLSPWWMGLAIAVTSAIQNDWMHMNVTWRSTWLEWVFVTPRYHHIHHSDNSQHYMVNMANLLTAWDRLFGTYFDPDTVDTKLSFGIGAEENPARLVLGF
jgi:sterol desaturase/sphingolipid hydroxylase (fatty acid hydroxylase superfamily)